MVRLCQLSTNISQKKNINKRKGDSMDIKSDDSIEHITQHINELYDDDSTADTIISVGILKLLVDHIEDLELTATRTEQLEQELSYWKGTYKGVQP